MLVAADKFTKWVEAAPVTTQYSTAAINFIKSIIFRFGVPHSIITDNGRILHPKVQKLLQEHGHQTEVCISSTSKDKRTSRKSKWLNMQWYKEEAIGTPRES
jgi:transposase-like protein